MSIVKAFLNLLFIVSCYTSHAQIDSIKFGRGGGFAGEEKIFKVYKKHIHQWQKNSYTSCAKLNRKDRKLIFANAHDIFLLKYQFNRPYNTYKFIEIYVEGKSSEMVWGDPTFEVPPLLKEYFDQLIKISNNSKFNSK